MSRSLCKLHPDVDYRHAWGCPDCLAELRKEKAELVTVLADLQKQVREHVQFNVKKHFSLMVADVAASKAIAKAQS